MLIQDILANGFVRGGVRPHSRTRVRQCAICGMAFVLSIMMQTGLKAAGVWTPLTHPSPSGGSGTMLLLTDGTVMVQGPGVSKVWTKLKPDSAGNYINGTWTTIASMHLERLYCGTNVLPSGKLFLIGGEYSGPNGFQNLANSGEIYDPIANTWSTIAPFPRPEFGDDPTILLPTGNVLCGYIFDGRTYLYNPSTNTWSQTGTKLRSDQSDEETWLLLPDGSVISYDVFSTPVSGQARSQRYFPSTGKWVDAGTVPAILSSSLVDFELGPGTLLPNGQVFLTGATNLTALYNPSTNSWTAGPKLPTNMGADDAPGAMLPNGHFIFLADTSLPIVFTPPTKLFDFDYVTNTLSDITPTGTLGALLASVPAFTNRMLVLPNGHILLSTGDSVLWDYAPTGAPQSSWVPTIDSITQTGTDTYKLTGRQLTGISEGATYGDDANMSTNYPLVRIKSTTGVVTYARTTNWTPGVATGSLQTTVNFALPAGFSKGTYDLAVIANGIASATHTFTTGTPSNVTAGYTPGTKTLTITGDTKSNSLTVSLQAGVIKVEGANGTKINNTTSFSHAHTGQLILIANLDDGDDAISVIGVSSSTTTVHLGAGADKAAFTLCHIQNLTVDGGLGVDVLLTTSTTVGHSNTSNIP